VPLSAITVLDKLASAPNPSSSILQTPGQTSTLHLSLLHSSPPDGTELRQASRVFISQLCNAEGVPSPAKRFSKRMTQALESTQRELATLRKRVAEQEQLLHARKVRRRGKRVVLKGKSVFSTQEVLEVARQAEEEGLKEKSKKSVGRALTCVQIPRMKENVLDYVRIESQPDSDGSVEDTDESVGGLKICGRDGEGLTSPGITLLDRNTLNILKNLEVLSI